MFVKMPNFKLKIFTFGKFTSKIEILSILLCENFNFLWRLLCFNLRRASQLFIICW